MNVLFNIIQVANTWSKEFHLCPNQNKHVQLKVFTARYKDNLNKATNFYNKIISREEKGKPIVIDHVHLGQNIRNVSEASADKRSDVKGRRRNQHPLRWDSGRGCHFPRRNIRVWRYHRTFQLPTAYFKVSEFPVSSTATTTTIVWKRVVKHQRSSNVDRTRRSARPFLPSRRLQGCEVLPPPVLGQPHLQGVGISYLGSNHATDHYWTSTFCFFNWLYIFLLLNYLNMING